MIIVMSARATPEDVRHVVGPRRGTRPEGSPVAGSRTDDHRVIGDERLLKKEQFSSCAVEDVIPILKPYKLASREFRRENTVVDVAG